MVTGEAADYGPEENDVDTFLSALGSDKESEVEKDALKETNTRE